MLEEHSTRGRAAPYAPKRWRGVWLVGLALAVGCSDDGLGGGVAASGDVAQTDGPRYGLHDADSLEQPDHVAPPDAASETSDVPSVPDAAPPAAKGPPYPVVLAHGFFGTDSFGGLDFATYFYGVRDDLAKHGESLVLTPAVDPFNNSEARGAQLRDAILAYLEQTGHAKAIVIGHSQGGLDARFVAATRPDIVAAVVTYATPHKGSVVADVSLGAVSWPGVKQVVDALMNLAGVQVWHSLTGESSLSAAIEQLSTAKMEAFNAAYPNHPDVAYFSLTGRSALALAKSECKPDLLVDFLIPYESVVDPLDPMFYATREVIDGGWWKALPHDGLVRVEDARWGTFLGCVPADHLDEIGHLFGDWPGGFNSFDHKKLFRDLVGFLRARGY
ncbi:MAG: hypothetical protein RIT45_3303 [Pseudomonadota bacterium]